MLLAPRLASSLPELSNCFNPIFYPWFISPSSSDRSDDPKSGENPNSVRGYSAEFFNPFCQADQIKHMFYDAFLIWISVLVQCHSRRYFLAEDVGNVKLNTKYKIRNATKGQIESFKHKVHSSKYQICSPKYQKHCPKYILSKEGDIAFFWKCGQWKIKSVAVADYSID